MDILVDSCVWVQFLNSQNPTLRELLRKNKACINEVVMMELIPTFKLSRNFEGIDLLKAVKNVPLSIDWTNLQQLRLENLQNGINNIGIPDLIILQNALQNKLPICTLDKHFKLMRKIFDFELIEG